MRKARKPERMPLRLHHEGVWSVRPMIPALPAVWDRRQVFRLRRHGFGLAFPCVPTVAFFNQSSAITAAVPRGSCTRFPILPASKRCRSPSILLYVRIPHLFPKFNGEIRVKYLSCSRLPHDLIEQRIADGGGHIAPTLAASCNDVGNL